MASLSSKRSLFRTEIQQALTVVADTTALAISSTDSIIYQIVIANSSGTAANFTITDQNTTPLDLMKTVSIAANSLSVLSFPEGVLMKGGIKWLSGTASALNGQVFGLKI